MNLRTVFRSLSRRRWLRRSFLTVVVFITLVVLFHAEENWRGAREWARVKADLQARGEPLTWEELFPAVPEEENFFAALFVKEKLFGERSDWRTFLERASIGFALSAGWDSEQSKYELSGTLKSLRDNLQSPLPPETGRVGDDILAILAPIENDLEALTNAVARPLAVPLPEQLDQGSFGSGFSDIMDTSRLLFLRSRALQAAGRMDEACRSAVTGVKFGRALSLHAPTWMHHLLGAACIGQSLVALRDGSGGLSWNGEQLGRLEETLADCTPVADQTNTWRGDRIYALNYALNYAEKERATPKLSFMLPSGWRDLWMARVSHGIQMRIDGLEHHGAREEAGRNVSVGWIPPWPGSARVSGRERSQADIYFDGQLIGGTLITQAQVNIARIAIAVERHRRAHGALPAALTELAPYFPKGLPDDPVNGTTLIYVPAADGGFTVTSPGNDASSQDDDNQWKVPPPAPSSQATPPVR